MPPSVPHLSPPGPGGHWALTSQWVFCSSTNSSLHGPVPCVGWRTWPCPRAPGVSVCPRGLRFPLYPDGTPGPPGSPGTRWSRGSPRGPQRLAQPRWCVWGGSLEGNGPGVPPQVPALILAENHDTTQFSHFGESGEGNGTPLRYSCLENPRDGGAWWAAVCEVAQSRTRLKRLSSRSSSGESPHSATLSLLFLFGNLQCCAALAPSSLGRPHRPHSGHPQAPPVPGAAESPPLQLASPLT